MKKKKEKINKTSNLCRLRCGCYLFGGHSHHCRTFQRKGIFSISCLAPLPRVGRNLCPLYSSVTSYVMHSDHLFIFFLTTFCLWQISTWILLTKVCSPTPWQMSLWTQRWLPRLLLLRVWQRPRPRSSGRSLQRFCVLAVRSGVLWGPLCLKMSWSAGCAPGKLPWEPHRISPLYPWLVCVWHFAGSLWGECPRLL